MAALGALLLEEELGAPCGEREAALLLSARLRLGLREGSVAAFVAWAGRLPVGALVLTAADDIAVGAHYVASHFYVMRAYRRKGIGRLLLEAGLAALPEEGAIALTVTGKPVPRSYRRLGFVPTHVTAMARISDVRRKLERKLFR